MNFQYQYELCSLIILVCLTIQFLSMRKFPTKTNRLFLVIILSCIADMALDVLGCYTLYNVTEVPLWLTYIVNNLFFCFQIFIPVLMCSYVIYGVGYSYTSKPAFLVLLVPSFVFMGIQLINPFTHLVFEIREVDGVLQYCRGVLFPTLYVSEFFYLIAVIALIIHFRAKMTSKQKGTISLFVLVIIAASVLEIILNNILLTGMAMTISIMLMDMILQNPEEMLDGPSRTFNTTALEVFLSATISRGKPVYITVLDIDGLDILDRGNGVNTGSILEGLVGKFLLRLSRNRTWVFRPERNRFFIIANSMEELDRHSAAIVERFNKGWKVGNISIDLLAKVLCVVTSTSIQFAASEIITLIDEVITSETTMDSTKTKLVIDSALLAKLRRRHIIEESFRRSIKTDEGLYLCFQPIIDTKDSSFKAAEALLRYNDPNLGAVSPVEFIPVVEKCGMASYIDAYVINEGCKFLSRHPEVNLLHINLSAAEFYHNPAPMIEGIVSMHGIDPHRICLEITESSAATHPEILLQFMTEMNSKGFSFALDDYGTGFANVLQVLKLPFKNIKIDKTLLNENERSRIFLATTIKMFIEIGLEPVIEGVETNDQLKIVTDLGATNIQGFLFSPPLTESDYIRFANNGNRPN